MSDDLISREALKKVFGYTDEWYNGRTICAIIDNAPTVKLSMGRMVNGVIIPIKIPQGEWILDENTRNIICSCCKQSRRDSRTNHILYCNHCGAEMRKEADNNDL